MALSQAQLEALRDKIVNQMAAAESLQAGDKRIQNRTADDLAKALNRVEQDLAALGVASTIRVRTYRLRFGAE